MKSAADLLNAATAAQNRATAHAVEHKTAMEERDALILAAHEAGATYPDLAAGLGLHEARIKQVLTAQRKARRG